MGWEAFRMLPHPDGNQQWVFFRSNGMLPELGRHLNENRKFGDNPSLDRQPLALFCTVLRRSFWRSHGSGRSDHSNGSQENLRRDEYSFGVTFLEDANLSP